MKSAVNTFSYSVYYLPKKDKSFISAAYAERSLAYFYAGDTLSAYNDICKSIKITPKDAIRYTQRADIFYSIGNIEAAGDDYVTALKLDPANVDAELGVCKYMYLKNKYNECLNFVDKYLYYNPNESLLYVYKALCHKQLSEYSLEAKDIVNALRLSPYQEHAINLLADMAKNDYDKISAELKIQQKSNPSDYSMSIYLALVNFTAGEYEKALMNYVDILEDAPDIAIEGMAEC